jgi:hypothetical protein
LGRRLSLTTAATKWCCGLLRLEASLEELALSKNQNSYTANHLMTLLDFVSSARLNPERRHGGYFSS